MRHAPSPLSTVSTRRCSCSPNVLVSFVPPHFVERSFVMQAEARELFRHVSAEKSGLYRSIMDAFAAAKRQFRLHLRPDEVFAEAAWTGPPPKIEEVQA